MNQRLFEKSDPITRSAEVSDCGRYRWWLRRFWQFWDKDGFPIKGKGTCCFVMLNPSTADALQDDPTIRRCIGFARRWGYDTLSVRNLFPFRATDPRELLTASRVCGDHRGEMELLTACTADLTVVAWGTGVPFCRDQEALAMFSDQFPAKLLLCLGLTKNGSPRHPLYVKAETDPLSFR